MITLPCPECETPLTPPRGLAARQPARCAGCDSLISWRSGRPVAIDESITRITIDRPQAPTLNRAATVIMDDLDLPDTPEIDPIVAPCGNCGGHVDQVSSHLIDMFWKLGRKEVEDQGFAKIIYYPMFKTNIRVCDRCYRTVERRMDQRTRSYKWYLGQREIKFKWENTPNQTLIPRTERFRSETGKSDVYQLVTDDGEIIIETVAARQVEETKDANGNHTGYDDIKVDPKSYLKFIAGKKGGKR